MHNGRNTNMNTRHQGHMLAAQNGGHPVLPAQSRRALIARKETMSGIWRWPKLKPRAAI
jgi:hypothetical protein